MFSKRFVLIIAMFLLCPALAMGHTPLCSCYDNEDGTITCEGGFSDGSSAVGVRIFVRDSADKTLIRGAMDQDSEFTFKKPDAAYKVVFDGGPGHQVEVRGEDISE